MEKGYFFDDDLFPEIYYCEEIGILLHKIYCEKYYQIKFKSNFRFKNENFELNENIGIILGVDCLLNLHYKIDEKYFKTNKRRFVRNINIIENFIQYNENNNSKLKLEILFKTSDFANIFLYLDDEIIRIHKIVLEKYSKRLQDIFKLNSEIDIYKVIPNNWTLKQIFITFIKRFYTNIWNNVCVFEFILLEELECYEIIDNIYENSKDDLFFYELSKYYLMIHDTKMYEKYKTKTKILISDENLQIYPRIEIKFIPKIQSKREEKINNLKLLNNQLNDFIIK